MMKIVRPLLKLGLGGGAVYLVVDQGLFNANQKETIEASKKISDSIPAVPGLDSYLEKIPSGISRNDFIDYWNSGVKITVSTLASLPANSKDLASKGYHFLKDELKNQLQSVEKK